jgi:hypothetical protein
MLVRRTFPRSHVPMFRTSLVTLYNSATPYPIVRLVLVPPTLLPLVYLYLFPVVVLLLLLGP